MAIPEGAPRAKIEMTFIYKVNGENKEFKEADLEKSSEEGMAKLEALHKQAKAKGYTVLGLTASTPDVITKIKARYGHTFDYYFCDATTVKTIERANPSLIILERGTITQKLHHNDSDKLKL